LAGLRPEVLDALAAPGKLLVVVYREAGGDGFVITAFLTRRLSQLDRRKQIWP
jgi:hypothetical protein